MTARPSLPFDGFFFFFFSKRVSFTVKVEEGCLRLGGRHLEEDVSDGRDDDGGEEVSFLCPWCLEQRGKTLKMGEMWRLWEKNGLVLRVL